VAADPRQGAARARRATLLVAAAGVGAAWGYGTWRLATVPAGDGPPLRVAVVQPDVPEAWRTSLRHLGDTLHRLRALTADAVAARPDLVVWPENALTAAVSDTTPSLADVAALLPPSAHLLVGAPRLVREPDGGRTLRNALLVVDATGRVVGTYDKQRLTPYGETLPWTLSRLLPRPADAGEAYRPGAGGPPVAAGDLRLATVICWEAIYADLVRAQVRDGATLLVNVSNDGWFGRQPSLEQHFHATQLRAVETRRWLVRATNAGISAVVDPRGVVVATAPRDAAVVLPATVAPRTDRTPYVRLGDAFGLACVAVTALVVGRARRRARAPS
jgi:apolipoprotein N-acyltransferase